MKTLNVFVLEIAAVFIGITGSLLVENSRQQRQDREILDHLLQATHYNALQFSGYIDQVGQIEAAGLESARLLLYGDTDSLSDQDLIQHLDLAFLTFPVPDVHPGYQRLLGTTQSIPFDHTMAELDYQFVQLFNETSLLNRRQEQVGELRRAARDAAGLPEDPRQWAIDLVDESATQMSAVNAIVFSDPGYLADINDAAAIRDALRGPDLQAMLRDLIGLRYRSSLHVVRWGSWNDQVIATIRRYDPDVPLPIGVIEISGGATSVGWTGGLPMARDADDANVWRLRVELTDGQLKFRADHSFASNWGAPTSRENLAQPMGFDFGGDPSTVFPAGVATFGGLNIPVEAGTYDVTFNSQTFEYSFAEAAPHGAD